MIATAPLVAFEDLGDDRLVQCTSFETEAGTIRVLVNFSNEDRAALGAELPPRSVRILGAYDAGARSYRLGD